MGVEAYSCDDRWMLHVNGESQMLLLKLILKHMSSNQNFNKRLNLKKIVNKNILVPYATPIQYYEIGYLTTYSGNQSISIKCISLSLLIWVAFKIFFFSKQSKDSLLPSSFSAAKNIHVYGVNFLYSPVVAVLNYTFMNPDYRDFATGHGLSA